MTIASKHDSSPDYFTMSADVGDWMVSIVIDRGSDDVEEGISQMTVGVTARRWGRGWLNRVLGGYAFVQYDATITGLQERARHVRMSGGQGPKALHIAESFLASNRVRIDQIIELDDRIRTGDCRCSDCCGFLRSFDFSTSWVREPGELSGHPGLVGS